MTIILLILAVLTGAFLFGFRKFVLAAVSLVVIFWVIIGGLALYEMRNDSDASASTLHCTEYEHVLTDPDGKPVWCSPNRATP